MDLRNLPESIDSHERCAIRRMQIQDNIGVNLSLLGTEPNRIGDAEEKNCEQMFGSVPIPVGYAGPLKLTFSSGDTDTVHLPLATTEGALVASVNRGCKALSEGDGIRTTATQHGITRSIAFRAKKKPEQLICSINEKANEWIAIGEATSKHLHILGYDIDNADGFVFLTIAGNTDEAMGMNMITIAAQEIGNWIAKETEATLITIAANVDSDKKPSRRTHDKGRGYEVTAEVTVTDEVITSTLKSDPEKMLEVYEAKLITGSKLAGAIGSNLHAANVIAALYLATGQDAAHVVEGSMCDTTFERMENSVRISVRLPAILVGTIGGGTGLPAQHQCLDLLSKPTTPLSRAQQIAESIGGAVLAGEVSLLAAQAAQKLASSHKKMAR